MASRNRGASPPAAMGITSAPGICFCKSPYHGLSQAQGAGFGKLLKRLAECNEARAAAVVAREVEVREAWKARALGLVLVLLTATHQRLARELIESEAESTSCRREAKGSGPTPAAPSSSSLL